MRLNLPTRLFRYSRVEQSNLSILISEIQKPKAQVKSYAMSSEDRAVIYTDGACSGNGTNPDAQAGIGVYWGHEHRNNVSEPISGRQTNQRAELLAARRGIEQARDQGYSKVTVKTDSHYVKNGVESWMPNWEKNGWQKEVVNKSEFQELKQAMQGMDVEFEYVPSKSNAADGLARQGAKKSGNSRY